MTILAALVGCTRAEAPQPDLPTRRHVLLLTVDTLRPDYMSGSGYPLPTTPFLDGLLASGHTFSRAITPIPHTTPALASMLTGAYPHTHGVRTLFDPMRSDMVTLAELARAKGYVTVAVVSNLVLSPQRGLNRGFQVYDHGLDARDAVRTTDKVIRHLQGYERGDRVFLWVHYFDPHIPYSPPGDLAVSFDPDYRGRYQLSFGRFLKGVNAFPADLGKADAVFRNNLPAAVNAHVRKLYAADIRHTDNQIARLVTWLRDHFGDDWLVLFSADHGESLGEHDFYFDHGDYVYNETLRVPMGIVLAKGDPLQGATTVDAWVSLIDVLPTVVELLGLPDSGPLTGQLEGRSLVPYLRGEELPPRPLFSECGKSFFPEYVKRRVHFDVNGRFRSVILDNWKLIWTPGQSPDLEFELFRIDRDPRETDNLYRPGDPKVAELWAHLQSWFRPAAESAAPLTSGDREALRQLGYLE